MSTLFQSTHYLGDAEPLWQEWNTNKTIENRNRLFEYYFPWCRNTANRLFFKYRANLLEHSDVVQICSQALLNTIERFDPNKGVPYEGYAYLRLKGIVINEVSNFSEDYVKKDVNLREDYLRDRLPQQDNRQDPFDSIIDAAVGLAFGLFLELGITTSDNTESSPQTWYENDQQSRIILDLVERLGDQERFVVKCHYFQHLSFVDIANTMGLTRARISQIHHASISKLRVLFEEIAE